ncbi:MAG: hypothetical protein KC620_11720, partial [Myxococcales bacterium]|nr:hypothetical protein [Myxococcales bacterium]
TPPPAADEAPTAAPSPPVAPSWAAPPEAPKGPPLGRMGAAPMPEVPVAVVKDHIRRYYGNLPRNGRMPARILAEELLPLDVIRGLNIPPDSRVIELGHHPTTTLTGFEEALALPEDQLGLLGITVKTADGREYRDYIHTIPQQ